MRRLQVIMKDLKRILMTATMLCFVTVSVFAEGQRDKPPPPQKPTPPKVVAPSKPEPPPNNNGGGERRGGKKP
jgi:hypothetical protein